MTRIDIVSGFLGAGKTTLIKKILDEKDDHEIIAIIENEFGDVGIDGDILKQPGIQVEEIYSGCICCTLIGNFERALTVLIEKYRPDRIIIEPTGIAKLSDVQRACEEALGRPDVRSGMRLVVVNALNYDMYMRNWPEFFINQIEQAKTVVFSRSQLTDARSLEKVVQDVHRINPDANTITTPWDEISARTIISAAQGDASLAAELEPEEHQHTCSSGHHHRHENHKEHHDDHGHEHEHEHEHGHDHEHEHDHEHDHSADEVFEVWGIETPKTFEKLNLLKTLKKLDDIQFGMVLRAKGIVQLTGGNWIQFDYVPGEINFKDRTPDYTGRLCVIGEKLDKEALAELFGIS